MKCHGKYGFPRRFTSWACIVTALLACAASSSAEIPAADPAPASGKFEILALHSYHSGFEWTESSLLGLIDELGGSPAEYELYNEFLDTKRFRDLSLLDDLLPYLVEKYAGIEFDAVFISDDNALNFFLKHRERIAPGVPAVFCGVNSPGEAALELVPGLTGVFESVDLAATIGVALDLHPATEEILVVYDRTSTNLALRDRLVGIIPEFGDRVRFHMMEEQSMEQVLAEMEAVGQGTVVLFLSFTHGGSDGFLEFNESIALLREVTRVPIYSCWDFYLGHGIVGGMVTDGRMQGRVAGEMLLDVLAGAPIDSMPLRRDSANRYMFDDRELRRFGIDQGALPEGSEVINSPPSFYEVNRRTIHAVSAVASVMALVILVLSTNIVKRRRAEAELIAERGRLRRALAQESLLAEAADLLNSTEDFRTVLDDLFNVLIRRMDIDRISMHGFSEKTRTGPLLVSKVSARGRAIEELPAIDGDKVRDIYEMLRRSEGFVTDDVKLLQPDVCGFYTGRNIGSIVVQPMKVTGRVKGVIAFAMVDAHRWGDDELSTFGTLADMIGNAWERHDQMLARLQAEQKHTEAIQQLEESSRMASIGVMAAGITHEINQPLNAIRVTTDSAMFFGKRNPGAIPGNIADKLRKISDGAKRIDAIVRHMRNFRSVPDEDGVAPVDLNSSVRNAVGLVERQMLDHGISPRIEVGADPLLVMGHELQIEQIVINLVANSIKSIDTVDRPEKYVRIATGIDAGGAWLEVRDNGAGLPDEADGSIFDPFFSTMPPGEGTGLGLAIVKRFVSGFGGEISHRNNSDGGASFLIRLRPSAGQEVC